MAIKCQHKELRSKKTAIFCDGDVIISKIGDEGHFDVPDEATLKAMQKFHPNTFVTEKEKGYEAPTIKTNKAKKDSVYAAQLELDNDELKKKVAALEAQLVEKTTVKKSKKDGDEEKVA